MPTYQCKLVNITARNLRVIVISLFGQQTYVLRPHQSVVVSWYPGIKVVIAFDATTGALVSLRAVNVQGPMTVHVGRAVESEPETEATPEPAEGELAVDA